MTIPEPFGIYYHVPFCASRCPYCDFYSHCPPSLIPAYVDAALDETRTLRRTESAADTKSAFGRRVTSVYFGGGTPSMLPAFDVGRILDAVRQSFALTPDAEITLECNPGVSEPERYFEALASAGVNRLSLGLQSAVDAERKTLGRRSGPAAVSRAVGAARAAGIGNLSLDVMAGIPRQTMQTLRRTLDFVLSLQVPHVSVYLLSLEPGTFFYKKRASLDLPDEDGQAEMYLFVCEYLAEHGFRHYEISNFCRGDRVGRHNLAYWTDAPYLGIGPGAHGFWNGLRYSHTPDLSAFLNGAPAQGEGPGGDPAERLMLALRTDLGVDPARFSEETGARWSPDLGREIGRLRGMGLLRERDGAIALTDRGMLLSNRVIFALTELLIPE